MSTKQDFESPQLLRTGFKTGILIQDEYQKIEDNPLTIEALELKSNQKRNKMEKNMDLPLTNRIKLTPPEKDREKKNDTIKLFKTEGDQIISPINSARDEKKGKVKFLDLEIERITTEVSKIDFDLGSSKSSLLNSPYNRLDFDTRGSLLDADKNIFLNEKTNNSRVNTSTYSYSVAMKALQDKTKKLEKKYNTLENEKKSQDKLLKELEESNSTLLNEINEYKAERHKLISDMERINSDYTISLKKQNEESNSFKNREEILRRENEEYRIKIEDLQESKKKAKLEIKRQIEEIQELRKQILIHSKNENENIGNYQNLISELKKERDELNSKIKISQEENKKLEKEYKEFKKAAQNQIQDFTIKNDALTVENSNLRQYFSHHMNEFKKELDSINETNQIKVDELERRLETAERQKNELSDILNLKSKEADSAKKKLESFLTITMKNEKMHHQQQMNRSRDAYASESKRSEYENNTQRTFSTQNHDESIHRAGMSSSRGFRFPTEREYFKTEENIRITDESEEPSYPTAKVNRDLNKDLEYYLAFEKNNQLAQRVQTEPVELYSTSNFERKNMSFGLDGYGNANESIRNRETDFISPRYKEKEKLKNLLLVNLRDENQKVKNTDSIEKKIIKQRELEEKNKEYQDLSKKVHDITNSKERSMIRSKLISLTGEISTINEELYKLKKQDNSYTSPRDFT